MFPLNASGVSPILVSGYYQAANRHSSNAVFVLVNSLAEPDFLNFSNQHLFNLAHIYWNIHAAHEWRIDPDKKDISPTASEEATRRCTAILR